MADKNDSSNSPAAQDTNNENQLDTILEYREPHLPADMAIQYLMDKYEASANEAHYASQMMAEFIFWVQHPCIRDDHEIAQLEKQIAEINRRKRERIEQYGNRLTELAQHVPDKINAQIASMFYWYEWESVKIPSRLLAVLLKCKPGSVWMKVPKAYKMATCQRCGAEFEVAKSSRSNPFAVSTVCINCASIIEKEHEQSRLENRDRLRLLKTMPYREYLETEHWKSLRASKLKQAGYKCQLCNRAGVQLHVHHRTYERRGEERSSDLIVLCAECHQTFHDRMELEA